MLRLSQFPCCDPSVHYVKVKAKNFKLFLFYKIENAGKCQDQEQCWQNQCCRASLLRAAQHLSAQNSWLPREGSTGTSLTPGKVQQHLALLPRDKSPSFGFAVTSPCAVPVVKGQFKEPPGPALVFSGSQPAWKAFPWNAVATLCALSPWSAAAIKREKSWILWMMFCFIMCFQLLN